MPFFQKGIQKCIKRGSKLDKKKWIKLYIYTLFLQNKHFFRMF